MFTVSTSNIHAGCSDSTWANLPVAGLFLLATLLLAKQLNAPPGGANSISGHTVRSKLSRTSSSRNLQRPNRSQFARTPTAAASAELGSDVKSGLHGSERVQRQESSRGGQNTPPTTGFSSVHTASSKIRDWRLNVGSPLVAFAWEKLCNSIVQQVRETGCNIFLDNLAHPLLSPTQVQFQHACTILNNLHFIYSRIINQGIYVLAVCIAVLRHAYVIQHVMNH